jgi:hypothetical protein
MRGCESLLRLFPGNYRNKKHSMRDGNESNWKPIATAPFDRDIALAVIGYDGVHAVVFPCRRILGGWIKSESRERIEVYPTHWREWDTF